jgi:hypothetical protein
MYHRKNRVATKKRNFAWLPSEPYDIEKMVGQGGIVQRPPPVSEKELKGRK